MPTPKEYQALLEGGCPYCGEALVIKQGKHGEFVACAEWCGYTKSIPGRSFFPPKVATKKKCPLNKCDGFGLIPFTKNGKIILNAFIDCECKLSLSEHYNQASPEDFDFPCSYDFRSFYEELLTGKPLPSIEPSGEDNATEKELPITNVSLKAYQQQASMIRYLQRKVNEHIDKSRRKPGPESQLRGIEV